MEVVIVLKIDLGKNICSIKKKMVNLKVFNMIKEINKPKTLIRNTSCKFGLEFSIRKCSSKLEWDVNGMPE